MSDQAKAIAEELCNSLFGMNEFRHWFLGVWDVYRGRLHEARVIRDTLEARGARTGDRRTTLVARPMAAHVALAEGDATLAIRLFDDLTPTADRASLQHPWESLGLERFMHARVLLATGQYQNAHRVAATFDSPGVTNIFNPMFLPASLEIRLEAARAMNDAAAVRTIEARLSALGR